jgi:hypothetical protein
MRIPTPNSCRHCAVPERVHFQRWSDGIGMHTWVEPTDEQRKARMLARREDDERIANRRARKEREPARERETDEEAAANEAETAAFLDAAALVRESGAYESAVVAEIRRRDTAAGADRHALDQAAADRRTLLGLYDHANGDLELALEDLDELYDQRGDVHAVCKRLIEHAHLIPASDRTALGIHRAVNAVVRALKMPQERGDRHV